MVTLKESSHCWGFLAAAGVCQCGSQSTANEAALLTEQHRLPQAANQCRECLQAERCSGSALQRLEAGAGRMKAVKWEHFNPNGLAETATAMRAGGRASRIWLPALLDLNPATRGKQGSVNVKKQTTLGFSKFVLIALELTKVQVKVTAACSVVLCGHGAHPCMPAGSFARGTGTGEGWHLPFSATNLGGQLWVCIPCGMEGPGAPARASQLLSTTLGTSGGWAAEAPRELCSKRKILLFFFCSHSFSSK